MESLASACPSRGSLRQRAWDAQRFIGFEPYFNINYLRHLLQCKLLKPVIFG